MKSRAFKTFVAGLALGTMLAAMPAQAQRRDTAVQARLTVRDQCLFSNINEVGNEQTQEFLGALIAPILAGIGGQLAGNALTALSNAIMQASQEHAFTASGTAGYYAGNLARAEGAGTWSFSPERRCLILVVPGQAERNPVTVNDFVTQAIGHGLATEDDRLALLQDGGLPNTGVDAQAPALYVELAVIPRREATRIVPTLVWYRQALGENSRRVSRPLELLVELATPGMVNDQSLGTLYSVARLQLPELQAGAAPLERQDLERRFTQFYPNRPTTGSVDTRVAANNTVETAVGTARTAVEAARRTLEAAEAATPANAAAIVAARYAHADAQATLTRALASQQGIASQATSGRQRLEQSVADATATRNAADAALQAARLADSPDPVAIAAREAARADASRALAEAELRLRNATISTSLGAVNARVSFIVIQDPSAFGTAVAQAIGSQSSALATAVTRELTPQPAWDAPRSTYVTAMNAVQTAQVSYTAALASNNAVTIATAHAALINAQAQANLAAAAINEPLPYPGILDMVRAAP